MNINRVTLAGRLGADPEYKKISEGKELCKLSIATTEFWYNDKQERQEKTSWHRVSLWGKRASWVKDNATKGDRVFVEGKINYSEWNDDKGLKKYSTDIVADSFTLLSSKKNDSFNFTVDQIPF